MKEKKTLILTLITFFTLIVVVIGMAYAYFALQVIDSTGIQLDAISGTTDELTFDVGDDMYISLNHVNLAPGAGNLSDETTASATLTANKDTNSATYNYNVYLKINTNEFIHTTETEETEILLEVTDPNNNKVTSINGLTYNSTLGGFDITGIEDVIVIADNYTITTASTITHEWNFKVTFINLNSDQEANTGRIMSANVMIQKDNISTFANYLKSTYSEDGVDGLYLHDGFGTYTNANQEIGDNSYRYSGANPKNYVCFGSDAAECPTDNLYRIIGIFGTNVKLIKADYATDVHLGTGGNYMSNYAAGTSYKGNLTNIYTYRWNSGSSYWYTSGLNVNNLNGTYIEYLNNIDVKWTNLITRKDWKSANNPYSLYELKPYEVYINETTNATNPEISTQKIGLMYFSDYGYAASPENWSNNISAYNNTTNRDNNWLFLGEGEYTIQKAEGDVTSVYITTTGNLSTTYTFDGKAVRPTFYLSGTVAYDGGTGTSTDPYRIY